METLTIHPSIR